MSESAGIYNEKYRKCSSKRTAKADSAERHQANDKPLIQRAAQLPGEPCKPLGDEKAMKRTANGQTHKPASSGDQGKPPAKHGKKSPELITAILDEISTSPGVSTTTICKKHNLNIGTWMEWLEKDEGIATQYARAKEFQSELMAEEIIQLADECMPGERTKTKSDGTIETTTGDMVERSKLRVDARKWVAARLLPKKYGDRIQQDVSLTGDLKINVIDRFENGKIAK